MSAPHASGPFRRDARVERVAEMENVEASWDALRGSAFPGLDVPEFFAVLGLATMAMGVALDFSMPALAVGVALLAVWLWLAKQWRDARRKWPAELDHADRRCAFTSDAILLESSRGRTAWPYAAVRAIQRHERWLILRMSDQQALVLRAEGEAGASLAGWIAARAKHLSNAPPRTRTLLLLAILYVMLAAAVVTVLPTFIAP